MPTSFLLPPRARRTLAGALRPLACRSSIALLKVLPTKELSPRLLRLLIWGWGNRTYSADLSYLTSMARLAGQRGGPVLECGSGLSTVVLGVLAARHDFRIFVLEHDRRWHDRVSRVLRRHRLGNVHLNHAPLRRYGEYDWYAVDGLSLPDELRLVVCDGPPGPTLGGRYGLLPVVGSLLAPRCLILLDDADRPGERQVLDLWCRRFPVELVETRNGARHALLRVGGDRADDSAQ